MPGFSFPAGKYLTAPIDIPLNSGGQTHALLRRNRLFVTEAGISPTVLTFAAYKDFAGRREELLERGLLLPEIGTANIYEYYREHGWGETAGSGAEELPDISEHLVREDSYADGTPMRRVHQVPTSLVPIFDYLRADGTPYLRVKNFAFKQPHTWPDEIDRVDEDGRLLPRWTSLHEWYAQWLLDLSAGEQTFVFVDSRFNVQHMIPMPADHLHLIYQIHNIHIEPPRHWSSPHPEFYGRALDRASSFDALVTLTQRQSEDIARAHGAATNLFHVPNPVETVPHDGPLPERDPHLVSLVARLESQKRIKHAIEVFDTARRHVPQARFDIYGSGTKKAALQEEIDRRGLSDRVTLKGHDPRARETLWRSSAFLVTSAFEGWNLAMQESMSHGCPVIAYDVKYGPREQITDGVNGFLVPDGDKAAMAERLVQLLTTPELVQKISAASMEYTARSSTDYVAQWQGVLEKVVEQKPRRTTLRNVTLRTDELKVVPTGTVTRTMRKALHRALRFAPGLSAPSGTVHVGARVTVQGRSEGADLSSARLTLAAVHAPSGHYVDLPAGVTRDGKRFRVESDFSLAEALTGAPLGASVSLRLQLAWENSTWQGLVGRPEQALVDGVEVSYDDDDAVRLRAWADVDG